MRIISSDEARRMEMETMANAKANVSVSSYDEAMEEYIKGTRIARGYTTREPSMYSQSSNPQWKSDADEWMIFIDRVMAYGLAVQNAYGSSSDYPTIDEFKEHLATITCNWKDINC